MVSHIKVVAPSDAYQSSATSGIEVRERTQAPIGIFDSGVGGITVLRELYQQIPNESVIYVGDTAHLPYGDRSPDEIIHFVRNILAWMAKQQVKMAIMACNTSSAVALEAVRSEFSFPILGVILPGAQAAIQQGRRIGVMATRATVTSHCYHRAITEIRPQAQVWEVSCPKFVHLIENNRIHEPITRQVVQHYLEPLLEHQVDTIIYGCTHYPHLAPIIKSLVPPSINLVDPALHVVAAAHQELDLLGLKHLGKPLPTRFCVTSSSQQFAQVASQWLGYSPVVKTVTLHNTVPNTIPNLHLVNQVQLQAV
jgi:glutamate racemase